jgi:hypothetical protein
MRHARLGNDLLKKETRLSSSPMLILKQFVLLNQTDLIKLYLPEYALPVIRLSSRQSQLDRLQNFYKFEIIR